MKLIIDISEEAKRRIDTFKGKFLCGDGFDLIEAIKNGIPLDDVKAEIITERHNLADDKDWGRYYGLGIALEILDNIGKADMRGGKE